MDKLENLTTRYQQITENVIDYEKYNLFALSHHSTVIEGNTLTEIETQVFLEEGLTAKGKPLEHHLMVKDHLDALQFVLDAALRRTPLSMELIRETGMRVMKNTGSAYNTALGTFDSSKGDLRLLNVTAGIGGKSYMNYSKVPSALQGLCTEFGERIFDGNLSVAAINDLAYLLHYQFVTIHPFADGNGRTGRLLMNYVQAVHRQPLTMIPATEKVAYIEALSQTRSAEDITIFLDFMRRTHLAYLESEIIRLSPENPGRRNVYGINLLF